MTTKQLKQRLYDIIEGIENDRFTIENIQQLIKEL
jgi:hypothetical protein